MANGDIAAAAGLPVVAPTADIRQGYDEINKTRDQVATHMISGTHAWNKITGKPTTFPPAAHEQDWSTITNKPTTYPAANQAQAAVPLSIPQRNAQGTFAVSGPTAADHVATKGYVDTVVAAGTGADKVSSAAYARTVGSSNYSMWMDGALNIGRNVSARKYKTEIVRSAIKPEDVLALEPVTYRRKGSRANPREFGLIADDVARTLPEVITYYDGEIDGIRYDLLGVALLAVVKDQQARIEALEAQMKGEV